MATRVITVFGGSGFIGRHLVQRLARRGWIIRVAVRRPDKALFLKPLGDVGQITPIAASLAHPRSVQAAVAGADAVVNLVGILYERGRQRFATVHAEGARLVAEAAKAAGVKRLVHMSALGVDRYSPSEYARSKAAGEAAASIAFPAVTIVRPSVVFGPEDQLFNRFAALARISPVLPLVGGGNTRFQPVFVGDVADAIAEMLETDAARGRTYELGGPRVYTLREIMELTLQVTNRKRFLMPMPFWLASFQAAFLELLPVPPLTRDQVRLLQRDNLVTPGMPGLAELGIVPTGPEAILPAYLEVYRRGGRYAEA